MSENHPRCPRCRAEAPRPDAVTCPSLPPNPPPAQPTANVSFPEEQESGTNTTSPLTPCPSSRQDRDRQRHRRQNRTREKPDMMLDYLARGAEQERARHVSAVPQQLPYRRPNPSLEDVMLADPPSPMRLHTPATTTTPAPSTDGGPGETHGKLFSDPLQFNIPDQLEGPPYFHVKASCIARQEEGQIAQDPLHIKPSEVDRIGFWKSLPAAQEAAVKCSGFQKFNSNRRVVTRTILLPGGTTEEVRDNLNFTGRLDGIADVDTLIEIVESDSITLGDESWPM